MSKHFVRELEQLMRDVLVMGGLAEAAVAGAVHAFLECDSARADHVAEGDQEVNAMELRIEEEVLKILSLYGPTAKDLRCTVGAFKITNDLERVGDLAVNIAGYDAEKAEKEEACEEEVERRQACHSPCPTPDLSHRAQVTDCLSGTPNIPPGDPRLPHGRLLSNTCLETPKDGRDREAMLDYKVRRLADLMRLSKKTILYIDATTTTAEGFDSKKAVTYCEVKCTGQTTFDPS